MIGLKIPKPILALAPMAGITDSAFRLLCRELGADLVYSEMASATALFYKPAKTLELIQFCPKEQPYIVQLFGKEPEHFAHAAKLVSKGIPTIEYGGKGQNQPIQPPAGIDINFGCPAKKVFGHGSGAALMDKPELARAIIKAVKANTTLPISLKVRTEVKGVTLMDFLKKIQVNRLGISHLMVHGRSYSQGFSGPVDYKSIKEVKSYFNGQVIANGGIKTLADAKKMLVKTQADGLGIGTGVYGNPEIFQILQGLKSQTNKPLKNKAKIVQKHAQYVYQLKKNRGIIEMRKHLLWYFKSIPNIKKLRPQMVQVSSLTDIKKIIAAVENLCKN